MSMSFVVFEGAEIVDRQSNKTLGQVHRPACGESLWTASIANKTLTGRTQTQLWLEIRRHLEQGGERDRAAVDIAPDHVDGQVTSKKLDTNLPDEHKSHEAIVAGFDEQLSRVTPANHGESRLFRRYHAKKSDPSAAAQTS